MCFNRKYLPIKSRFVRRYWQFHHVWTNCGHCPECNRARRNQYMIRNFFESLATFQKGGYIFLDTLTFNDYAQNSVSLPTFKTESRKFPYIETGYGSQNVVTVPCFDYESIQSFWKNLRRSLCRYLYKKHGISGSSPDAKVYDDYVYDNLRYFCVPEYGKQNYRPHYHLCLYCTIPEIDNKTLKRHINLNWRGIPFTSEQPDGDEHSGNNFDIYTHYHQYKSKYYKPKNGKKIYFDNGATDPWRLVDHNTITDITAHKHIRYITKYVLKDSKAISEYIDLLGLDYPSQLPKELKTRIRASLNFGAFSRVNQSEDLPKNLRFSTYYDENTQTIMLPYNASTGGKHHSLTDNYPLTTYHFRKLYYKLYRLPDKTYVSLPNDEFGKMYRDTIAQRYKTTLNKYNLHLGLLRKSNPTDYYRVLQLMSGYDVDNLVCYCLFENNKVFTGNEFHDNIRSWSFDWYSSENDIVTILDNNLDPSSPSDNRITRSAKHEECHPLHKVISILEHNSGLLSEYYEYESVVQAHKNNQLRTLISQYK